MNWFKPVAPPCHANDTLVREFYKLAIKEFDSKGLVIMGREISIDSELINAYYKIPNTNEGIKDRLDLRLLAIKDFEN